MHEPHHHEKNYRNVLASLLVLTIITVWVSYFDFGIFNIVVAMAVASVKATLVALFFMHLKYDNRTNQVVFISSFVFLAIFIGLAAGDIIFRYPVDSQKFKKAELLEIHKKPLHEDVTQPSPSLIKRGEELYKVHCLSCHGVRTFVGSPKDVFKVLTVGVPGTRMPSYSDLGEKERWALTHYILSAKPSH